MVFSGQVVRPVSGAMGLMAGNNKLRSPEVLVLYELSMKIKTAPSGPEGRMDLGVELKMVGNLTPKAQVKSGPSIQIRITLYGWEGRADFGTMIAVVGNRYPRSPGWYLQSMRTWMAYYGWVDGIQFSVMMTLMVGNNRH